jgi:uncharacterized membrane protein YhhN
VAALAAVALVAAAVYLLALAAGWPVLALAAKPLPVLALAALAQRAADRYARGIALGLALSAVGDLAIEADFLAGLALFLLAHLVYIGTFVADVPALRAGLGLAIGVAAGAPLAALWPGLGAMALPVTAYAAVLGTMLWRAAARIGASPRGGPSARWALGGAVSFAVSDTLLALDRFRWELPGARVLVILLYWAGQAGLAFSALRRQPPGR